MKNLLQKIEEKAFELGLDRIGVAPAKTFPEMDRFQEWLDRGYHGKMAYLSRQKEKRLDLRKILPSAQSVICVAMNYHTQSHNSQETPKDRGWISCYAWGEDYHKVLGKKLDLLCDGIRMEIPSAELKPYVDTGPLLEKVFAKYAGIGWIGKNTCLINTELGSWLFLGVILTNLDLPAGMPPPDACGDCRRCLNACPTQALVEPYVLNAQKCISYLTIELRESIPDEFHPWMGQNLYGCDICQEVCPWNRKAPLTSEPAFKPRPENFKPLLSEITSIQEEEFPKRFERSPIRRAQWSGLLRNATIAHNNS
ncbi:MAG: tRNA epoxyqueuosine(34) reductase QueG [Deltaproteobacteria bacterium]|nr:tRNA epoxyqueuosine(34) reductase QueG [Deltaproteobacteria bacterium]